MPRRAALLVAGLAGALVAGTAAPSSSDDATVTWDQVRALLVADGRLGPTHPGGPTHPSDPAHPGGPGHPSGPGDQATPPGGDAPATAGAATVVVTIPDLSWAIDDPTAPAGTRRAACHQVLRTDDETAAPMVACLAHVGRPPRPPGR